MKTTLFSPLRRVLLALALGGAVLPAMAAPVELLNVSYDVARELYKDINPAFVAEWKKTTGESKRDDITKAIIWIGLRIRQNGRH